jgi:Tol biopolymer transport system component
MKFPFSILFVAAFALGTTAEDVSAEIIGTLPVGKLAFVTSHSFGSAGIITVLGQKTDPFFGGFPDFTVDGNLVFSVSHPPPGAGLSVGGLYVRNLSANTTSVIDDSDQDADSPCLSPDGSRLVYVVWPVGRESSHICISDVDGSHSRALTSGDHNDWGPRWSPDGKKILFESTRDGERQVYVMNRDGSHPVNLSHDKILSHAPSWSPDGTHIAYMSYGKNRQATIFVMRSDGTEKTDVSHGKTRDSEPVWSPDGKWIAFTRTAGKPPGLETMDIWIMKSDGTEQRQITRNAEDVSSYQLAWSR